VPYRTFQNIVRNSHAGRAFHHFVTMTAEPSRA
jgi:hypothetical protein